MLQLEQNTEKQSPQSIAAQLRGLVQNNIDLLEVASKLKVTPRTVRKIISGQGVSPYIRTKIQTAMENDGNLIKPPEKSIVQHLLEINRMYQNGGTLRAVGEKVGLSGERIRQLLITGAEVGLFAYQPTKPPIISKQKILSDYKKYLNFGHVAKANNISIPYLKRLRMFHKIEREDLHAIRWASQRKKCIEMYLSMKEQIGHFPTTTDLQELEKGRYLHTKVLRLWGSFGAFRQAIRFSSRSIKASHHETGTDQSASHR
ncbi:MAG: hypothetical protein ACE5FY_01370 [Nitrospiria bacterium]